MGKKFCIVHIPNHLDPDCKSGSSVRPRKMVEAFKSCGYSVDFVEGYGAERQRIIKRIKERVQKGVKYDFMYAESSTMPTLLTEKDHFPRYPVLDFGFYRFCHDHGIKIGLFYRDIQWKFSIYKDHVAWYKRLVSIPFYKYDLLKYRNLVDVLYLPTHSMIKYLDEDKKLVNKVKILMPGGEDFYSLSDTIDSRSLCHAPLRILYVGGVDKIYDLKVFLSAIKKMGDEVKVTLCCRENEWLQAKKMYRAYLGKNISVIHKSGDELAEYYKNADLCCAFAGKGEYMSMAMPVKVFEYLGFNIPILATKGTEAGKFVEQNDIGWSLDYNEKALTDTLRYILDHPEILKEKRKNEQKIINKHTWKARAEQVIFDLK